jgi:hypothetical protein
MKTQSWQHISIGLDHHQRRIGQWCQHCRKSGQTKGSCWAIHGKPADGANTAENQVKQRALAGLFMENQPMDYPHVTRGNTVYTKYNESLFSYQPSCEISDG